MKRYLRLLFCLIALIAFISLVPLLMKTNATYVKIQENSERMGIDNSTLFYSEEPRTSTAERVLKTRLKGANE
jgi:hypothetical protein